jgi:hypothetical protein
MSIRYRPAAFAALLFVSFAGASLVAKAADTQPLVAEISKPLILVGFTDANGGVALDRGRMERVIERIQGKPLARASAGELTNLCVAHTALRQLVEARAACDAALESALADRTSRRARYTPPRMADQWVAVAYSNRAVMHWLSSDAVATHNDLAKARALAPRASYVSRNVEMTERSPSLARAFDHRTRIG